MRRERAQELELDVGQLNRLPAHLDTPAWHVDHEPVGLDPLVDLVGVRARCLRAPQERPHARAELADRERLRDVVVGSELQPDHLVELVVTRREHDDRHRAGRPQPLADLEAVELRKHDVQHDEVGRRLAEAAQRLLAVRRLHHREPVAFEREREHLPHGFLVVDEEDGGGVGHVGAPAEACIVLRPTSRLL